MEQDGLVHREVPPRVEYTLTDHGTSLNEALRPLGAWWGTRRRERLAAGEAPPAT